MIGLLECYVALVTRTEGGKKGEKRKNSRTRKRGKGEERRNRKSSYVVL